LLGLLLAAAACSPADIVGNGELPPGVSDPKETQTPAGALRAYRGAVIAERTVLGASEFESFIIQSGLLSDELGSMETFTDVNPLMDRRSLPEFTDPAAEGLLSPFGFGWAAPYVAPYKGLHALRAKARVGAWLLTNFAPTESPALAAHLEAIEGYADIYLADMFCSGIPLSTVDPDGYTLQPGSTTAEVYQHAVAIFDTALAAATDSSRIVYMASVGKGRALLALGQYAAAAAAVANVPDGFEYLLEYSADNIGTVEAPQPAAPSFMYALSQESDQGPGMSDVEGSNGLDWIASGDPRTAAVAYWTDNNGTPRYVPASQSPGGGSPITVADWREARLIQAEASLAANDVSGWLATLNLLRQTAIAPALPDLVDPGTPDTRVDLLFRERGFWLYLTGHRLGDMRRLIRQYGRDPSTVFPIGRHASGALYGPSVNAPIPAEERRYNKLFSGCLDRGA
jgi:hypothetical protein